MRVRALWASRLCLLLACAACEEPAPRYTGPELPGGAEPIAALNAFGLRLHTDLLVRVPDRTVVLAPSVVARTTALAKADTARTWTELDTVWLEHNTWRDWERIDEPGIERLVRFSLWSRDQTKKRQRDAERVFRARAGVLSGDPYDDQEWINRWGKTASRERMHRVLAREPKVGREIAVGVVTCEFLPSGVEQTVAGEFRTPEGAAPATFLDIQRARAYRAGGVRAFGIGCATSRYELVVFPDRTVVTTGDWAALHAEGEDASLRVPSLKVAARSHFAPEAEVDIRHAAWLRVRAGRDAGDPVEALAGADRVVLDRPFLFAIRDMRTGLVLLIGTVFQPET